WDSGADSRPRSCSKGSWSLAIGFLNAGRSRSEPASMTIAQLCSHFGFSIELARSTNFAQSAVCLRSVTGMFPKHKSQMTLTRESQFQRNLCRRYLSLLKEALSQLNSPSDDVLMRALAKSVSKETR